jgi:integrase
MAFLQGFVNYMVQGGKAPKTVQAYISAFKGFLEVNDMEVPPLRRRVRKPRVYVRSSDRAPTMEELRLVCAGADLETRALLLFLLSSGCRIGEALVIQRGDLSTEGGAHSVRIRPEIAKDRVGRYTFISGEAFEAVEAYLRTHDNPRLFPMTKARAYHRLTSALERRIAVQRSAGRRDVHPHSLRKFFFTTALKVLGRELAEALIGHKQYLDQAYRRLTLEEMAASYKRLEPFVTLFGQAPPTPERNNQLVANSEEVESLVSRGYELVAVLPNGRAVLRTPAAP